MAFETLLYVELNAYILVHCISHLNCQIVPSWKRFSTCLIYFTPDTSESIFADKTACLRDTFVHFSSYRHIRHSKREYNKIRRTFTNKIYSVH